MEWNDSLFYAPPCIITGGCSNATKCAYPLSITMCTFNYSEWRLWAAQYDDSVHHLFSLYSHGCHRRFLPVINLTTLLSRVSQTFPPCDKTCKGYIRFYYDVFLRSKRTKIVVSGHVSRAQNIAKCVCGEGPCLESIQCSSRSPSWI